MKSPLKLSAGLIVWFGSYMFQLTSRNSACWMLPAGASRTTILPPAVAVSIFVPAGTNASGAFTPLRLVGFEYGTGPATSSRRVLPPTVSFRVVFEALQRLIG